ncbi:MAG TPA: hypothetical protein VH084_28460 [Mycobacterium sp.]|jgi:hypothetical protein|nr:hypothetical protein [Mycobacterium sp.]
MQGRTPDFDATARKPHTAVSRVDIIQNGAVVGYLLVHAGVVQADRTAALMRTIQVEVSDPLKVLTPLGMTSQLAPFGTRMQVWRGVRIKSTEVATASYNAASPFTPLTSTGVMNGVKIDTDGGLILGP